VASPRIFDRRPSRYDGIRCRSRNKDRATKLRDARSAVLIVANVTAVDGVVDNTSDCQCQTTIRFRNSHFVAKMQRDEQILREVESTFASFETANARHSCCESTSRCPRLILLTAKLCTRNVLHTIHCIRSLSFVYSANLTHYESR